MPRNGTGTYTLPVAAYITLTTIISGDMNSNLSDISFALTTSLATTGVSTMTGPVRFANGAVTAPSMAFSDGHGVGFYRAGANQLGIAVTSVSVGVINASTTAIWGYGIVFGSVAAFASAVSFAGGITATTTVTGTLLVTGGLNVGFNAAPAIDTIGIGDAALLVDFNTGTAPRVQFDTGDLLSYTRASNFFGVFIGGTTAHTLTASVAYYNGYLGFPEITAPASAATDQATIYTRIPTNNARMFYKDQDGTETPMGASGYWELISTFTVATSVAVVSFALSKVYARLMIAGVSMSNNTSGTQRPRIAISENGGSSLAVTDGSLVGTLSGASTSAATSEGSLGQDNINNTTTDMNIAAEIIPANGTCKKSLIGLGQSETVDQSCAVMSSHTTSEIGNVNYLQISYDTGLIDAGKFSLYGQLL